MIYPPIDSQLVFFSRQRLMTNQNYAPVVEDQWAPRNITSGAELQGLAILHDWIENWL